MADRVEEVLEKQIHQLTRSLEAMEAGVFRTHHNGNDTTQESMDQHRLWIADLESALEFHRIRRGF